jgi:hypothetical protein
MVKLGCVEGAASRLLAACGSGSGDLGGLPVLFD